MRLVVASMEQARGEPARQDQLAIKGPTKAKVKAGIWGLTHGKGLWYHWVFCHFDIPTTFHPLHSFNNVLWRTSYSDQRNGRKYGIQSACSVKQL